MNTAIACPFCRRTLYQLRPQPATPTLFEYVGTAPLVKSDAQGTFMTCPRCAGRVLLDARDTILGLDAFRPARLQAGSVASSAPDNVRSR